MAVFFYGRDDLLRRYSHYLAQRKCGKRLINAVLIIGIQLYVIIIRAVDYIEYYLVLQKLNVICIIISHFVVNTDSDYILRYCEYSGKIFIVDIYDNCTGFVHSAAYFQLFVNKLRLCKVARIFGNYGTCKHGYIKICRL